MMNKENRAELDKAVEYILSKYKFIYAYSDGEVLNIDNRYSQASWSWVGLSYLILEVMPLRTNVIDYDFIEQYKDQLIWSYLNFKAVSEHFCKRYKKYILKYSFTCDALDCWEHEQRGLKRISK